MEISLLLSLQSHSQSLCLLRTSALELLRYWEFLHGVNWLCSRMVRCCSAGDLCPAQGLSRGTCSWVRWDYLSSSAQLSAIQLVHGPAGAFQHLHDPLPPADVKLCIKHLPVPWIPFLPIPASTRTVPTSCLKASMSCGVNPTARVTYGAFWDCHQLCLTTEPKHLQLPGAATHWAVGTVGLPKFLTWAVLSPGSKAWLWRWLGELCPSVPVLSSPALSPLCVPAGALLEHSGKCCFGVCTQAQL